MGKYFLYYINMTMISSKDTLEKHIKYNSHYKPNTMYWGLGIENEIYLEFDKMIKFDKNKFLKNHKRERYSVDYYTNYKKNILDRAFVEYSKNYNGMIPLMMNCHSFTKTDKNNCSRTMYTKLSEPNKNFNGMLLTELLFENNKYLKDNYDKNFVYEGDIIEFITLDFFNTSLDAMISELTTTTKNYIDNLQQMFTKYNIYPDYGTINIMKTNNPFAVYLTNMDNVGMFNNGTLHFNITLPTQLDNNYTIVDMDRFITSHCNYIRLIQAMEPILITIYGTPDPFSYIMTKNTDNTIFSSCSQRCAISRYIGLGTYDTDTMKTGKMLTDDIKIFPIAREEYGWYKVYHKDSAYNTLDELGYDINFNKHYNHGVEIRFFDHISDINKIKEVMKFLIHLGDMALRKNNIKNPVTNIIWNSLVVDCMKYGKDTKLTSDYIDFYNMVFDFKFKSTNITNLYYEIFDLLIHGSKINGMFSSVALHNNMNIIYYDV